MTSRNRLLPLSLFFSHNWFAFSESSPSSLMKEGPTSGNSTERVGTRCDASTPTGRPAFIFRSDEQEFNASGRFRNGSLIGIVEETCHSTLASLERENVDGETLQLQIQNVDGTCSFINATCGLVSYGYFRDLFLLSSNRQTALEQGLFTLLFRMGSNRRNALNVPPMPPPSE